MPIDLTDKIVALLVALGPDDVKALPPAERRRLADQCRRAVTLAEQAPTEAGVVTVCWVTSIRGNAASDTIARRTCRKRGVGPSIGDKREGTL
jgi:uncharacterized protein (DUF58 family)